MLDIIINPVSGKGKGKKALAVVEKILQEKKIPYTVHYTKYKNHAAEIVRELNRAQAHTNLITMGGDGSFHEVLQGIENFERVTLGLIPCGTGNDFVKAAGIPGDPAEALDVILAGKTGYVDFMQLNGYRALNCAGAGMDVDVLVRYSTMKAFRGKLKYYASLLDVLLHLQFHKVRITANGETAEKSVFLITAANGIYIGGGMPVSPESDPYDGYLNVVYVNEIPGRKVLLLLLKFLKGKHIDEPVTVSFKTKEVLIEVLDDGKIETDGEVRDQKTLHCTIVPDTLRIFRRL